jgi:hypothetical protein
VVAFADTVAGRTGSGAARAASASPSGLLSALASTPEMQAGHTHAFLQVLFLDCLRAHLSTQKLYLYFPFLLLN